MNQMNVEQVEKYFITLGVSAFKYRFSHKWKLEYPNKTKIRPSHTKLTLIFSLALRWNSWHFIFPFYKMLFMNKIGFSCFADIFNAFLKLENSMGFSKIRQ
jgi:hypothetical protein